MSGTLSAEALDLEAALSDLERRNVLFYARFLGLMTLLAFISHVLDGGWFKAAQTGAGVVAYIITMTLAHLGYPLKKVQWFFVVGVACTLLPSALGNGGLTDPRTYAAIATIFLSCWVALGTDKLRQVALTTGGLVLVIVILDVTGLLGYLEARESGNLGEVMFLYGLVLAVGVWRLFLVQQAQLRLLRRANADARSAQQAESRFLSNMSHEIRNPLNGVLGLVEQARQETDPKQVDELLGQVTEAGKILKQIVNDILQLKSLEFGSIELESKPFDYHTLRATQIALVDGLIAARNLNFTSDTDLSTLPRFYIGDSMRIAQIRTNILSNAVKFTRVGGTIDSTTYYDHQAGELVTRVSDTGVGMSPETIESIFHRFRQGETGTRKTIEGTGLGLAITKGLVDSMGGRIEVESELGKGSVFTVSIPLQLDVEKERARLAGQLVLDEDKAPQAFTDLSELRILCVDDDSVNRRLIKLAVARSGASVTVAASATQALDTLQKADFDLVLTDISMPEMDGVDLLREIRKTDSTTPVVAITGNVLPEDVDFYLSQGFVEVVKKPFEVDELIVTVGTHAAVQRME